MKHNCYNFLINIKYENKDIFQDKLLIRMESTITKLIVDTGALNWNNMEYI